MDKRIKHGMARQPLHKVWASMKQRCNNPNASGYKHYGGRGIKACQDWNEHFSYFRDWALANGWEKGLEIDRIDNDQGYSPNNCRIVDGKANKRNTSRNINITHDGQTKCATDWANDIGISTNTLMYRIGKNWPMNKIMKSPRHTRMATGAVVQLSAETEEMVRVHRSAKLAADSGFNGGRISFCLNGKGRQHRGFKWKYLKEFLTP